MDQLQYQPLHAGSIMAERPVNHNSSKLSNTNNNSKYYAWYRAFQKSHEIYTVET